MAMHNAGESIHVAVWPFVHELHQLAIRHYAFEGRCFVLKPTNWINPVLRLLNRKRVLPAVIAVEAVVGVVAVVAAFLSWVGRTGCLSANLFRLFHLGRLAGRCPVAGPED